MKCFSGAAVPTEPVVWRAEDGADEWHLCSLYKQTRDSSETEGFAFTSGFREILDQAFA